MIKVNLLPLKGLCLLSWSKALMLSFNVNKNLLISALSNLVCLLVSIMSAALSISGKSIKDIFP